MPTVFAAATTEVTTNKWDRNVFGIIVIIISISGLWDVLDAELWHH